MLVRLLVGDIKKFDGIPKIPPYISSASGMKYGVGRINRLGDTPFENANILLDDSATSKGTRH